MNINRFMKIEEAKHGLNRTEIARRMGVSPQALSAKILRNSIRITDLEKIAHAMDCDLEIKFVDCK